MISKVVRRTHLFVALALTPWVLVYTLSAMVMNHRPFFNAWFGTAEYELVEKRPYLASFPPEANPRQMAVQILGDLDLPGAFSARKGPEEALTVQRLDPVRPVRITYRPADQELTIEREVFHPSAFLERMHRKRGFQHDSLVDDLWAASVDFFILAMVVWVVSGLWMWWEMRATRTWGFLPALGGLALFAFFLMTI